MQRYTLLAATTLILSLFIATSTLGGEFPPMAESHDKMLQARLEGVVHKLGLEKAVSNGKLSLALAVVTDPEHPRLAMLNGEKMMYAASLPKIAILLGAAVALEEGRISLDRQFDRDLTDMIRVSCNQCATRVLERVGRPELIRILQSPEYGFYDIKGSGGLWVGKDYASGSAYKRDPLSNLSHGANAFQTVRFYYKLETGTLVSPEQSEMMLERLSDPAIKHKFVKGLAPYEDLEIHRKSGTWKTYHSDSALVRQKDHAYIIVALANSINGSRWLEQLAPSLHELAIRESKLQAAASH